MKNIYDPVEMCEAVRDLYDNASTKFGCTNILKMFTASRPSPDETLTQHFAEPNPFWKKLIGTTDNITEDAMETNIFTPLSNSFESTIQILQQGFPAPNVWQCMNAILAYAERTTVTKDIVGVSTQAALFTCDWYCACGGWSNGLGAGRGNER